MNTWVGNVFRATLQLPKLASSGRLLNKNAKVWHLSASKNMRHAKSWLDQATEFSLTTSPYVPCESDDWAGYTLNHPEVRKNCDLAFAKLQGVDLEESGPDVGSHESAVEEEARVEASRQRS